MNLNVNVFNIRIKPALYMYFLIFGFCLEATSQKIYGFMDRYFVSIDLENQSCDSLIAFSKRPFINSEFFAAIDRYNGRYFFSGGLPNYPGNFHIIDLKTLEIQSKNFYTGEMEYDPFDDNLYYIKAGYFYSLSVTTMKQIKYSKIFNTNGRIFGHVRCYLPQQNEFHFLTPDGYIAVIDCKSGNVICKINSNQENAFNPNTYTDKIYSVKLGSVYESSDCYHSRKLLTRIPDYKGIVNAQMATYNHSNETYIVPYWASNNDYKYALINTKKEILEKTIKQFCAPAIMDLQMIYDRPEALLRIVGDTLFVNKGKQYSWYLNGQLNCITTNNYLILNQNGSYKAKVDFNGYSSFTQEIIINNITSLPFEYTMTPTLTNNQIKLNFNNCQVEKISIYNLKGQIVFDKIFANNHTEYELNLDVGFLPGGLYILNVIKENKMYAKKFIKI